MGALKYGKLKVLLKESAQIVLSPGPVIFELRRLLKNYTSKDYLLLSGDPAIIGLACTIASDINNGRFNLLTNALIQIQSALDLKQFVYSLLKEL